MAIRLNPRLRPAVCERRAGQCAVDRALEVVVVSRWSPRFATRFSIDGVLSDFVLLLRAPRAHRKWDGLRIPGEYEKKIYVRFTFGFIISGYPSTSFRKEGGLDRPSDC